MKTFSLAAILFLALFISPITLTAQEHPKEHPTSKKGAGITKEALAEAIGAYVQDEADLKGGYFLVFDKKAKKPLLLTLKKVHKERLARVAEGIYFACADFSTPEGEVYDLDIFMKGPDKDHLRVTQIMVHKEAGEERYTWMEKGGMWEMVPIGKAKSTTEHPKEHPGEHPHRF